MAAGDGSWSDCSEDSWYEINDGEEDAEVIDYDDDHHKDFWNGEGIVDSFVKLDYDLEDSKSVVNVKKKLFSTSNVIKTVDDNESKQLAHEEEETKTEELLMGMTRSHSRPGHQVISQLDKAMETKEKKRGTSDTDSSNNNIICSCINGIDLLCLCPLAQVVLSKVRRLWDISTPDFQ